MDALVSLTTCVTIPLTLSNHVPNQVQEATISFPRESAIARLFFVYKVSCVEGK